MQFGSLLCGGENEWEFDDADAAIGGIESEAAHGLCEAGFDFGVAHGRGFDGGVGDFSVESDFPEDDDFSGEVGVGEELLFVAVSEGVGAFLNDVADVGFFAESALFRCIHGEFWFLFDA